MICMKLELQRTDFFHCKFLPPNSVIQWNSAPNISNSGLPLIRKLRIPTFHWPFKKETTNEYISFSFFCKPSTLLSSVPISLRFLRDFERKAFDFTNKSFFFFSASVARASASLVISWTHFRVQASSVKLIRFLALQCTFFLKMY